MNTFEPANSDETYDPQAVIDKWLGVWDELGTFAADRRTDELDRPRRCVVSMFSYPSGDLHMGHGEVFSISDAMARFSRMRGYDTVFPVGWDSFGLPAENAALERGLDPREWTYANIETQADSFRRLGVSFD
ncbi:class I tRNA ligase family protein [Nocardia jiangxiensis]|uniref:class I tRNA ligase family protein n=1 Tax=Nocardia jiangxiensis TaxID=282685 RepID=UPI0002EFFBF5|nr:class I tRNA ligase family protein [Nocardia jiangxiensis]